MTERIVYILGAGFSAPLGIPVIRNFIEKSKDLYFADSPSKYPKFTSVLAQIEKMSVCKNYYTADMFDIEEVLSTLDLLAFVGEPFSRNDFVEYIRKVVEAYTPNFAFRPLGPDDDSRDLFGNYIHSQYAYFVLWLFGLKPAFEFSKGNALLHPIAKPIGNLPNIRYDIITLNYDCALEKMAGLFTYQTGQPVEFSRDVNSNGPPILIKLHGSVDDDIVLPTWYKGSEEKVKQIWKAALELLRQANEIRFLGYSLPVSDNYIRHLLKAAVIDAPNLNLKQIDVVCLDKTSEIEKRYRQFVQLHNFRYQNKDIQQYLGPLFFGPPEFRYNPLPRNNDVNFERLRSEFMDMKKGG